MNRAEQVYTILFFYFYLRLILHYINWKLQCTQLYIIYLIIYIILCGVTCGGLLMVVYLIRWSIIYYKIKLRYCTYVHH